MTIPIYNSEIAPSHKRGLIAGLHAQFVGFGFAIANVCPCSFYLVVYLTLAVGRVWLLVCAGRVPMAVSSCIPYGA